MKRTLAILFILTIIFSMTAFANSAEPPGITIIVTNPPKDLAISIDNPTDEYNPSSFRQTSKLWETYYHLYYSDALAIEDKLYACEFIISYNGESHTIPMPSDILPLSSYSNVLTLDLDDHTIAVYDNPMRTYMLVALRVALTLLIESFVFFTMFGYRKRSSAIVFFVTNIATQTFLNAMFTGPNLGTYWTIGYFFVELVVFAAEMLVYAVFLHEQSRKTAVGCAILANFVSLFIGGALISYLPI